jgi:carbon-monoxide dehydrogenase medium subunit
VKAPRFTYHDPVGLDEALSLLAEYGEDGKVLAGGQSLMPVLNFRLARPAHLIDINRIEALADFGQADGGLSLGALARQRALERSALVAERCALISQAMPYVGHPQIRNRGTLGGSLAHADPAAELPAVAVATDATLTVARKGSQRVLEAEDFFIGELSTRLEADELLVRIDVPAWPERSGSSVQEVAMRLGDFALAGVVTRLTLDAGGRVADARIVCFGVGDRPLRQHEAEQSLQGAPASDEAFAEAGRIVSARVQPSDDIHASAGYRRRSAGLLTRRALAASMSTIKEAVA